MAWFCFTAFTFYSGSRGVIITDTMMLMVFLLASIISGPYIFRAQGGLGELLTNLMHNPNLPDNLLDYYGNIPGTGLGMSVVKEIVELHGGEVQVTSVPGAGTSVTVWLPAA